VVALNMSAPLSLTCAEETRIAPRMSWSNHFAWTTLRASEQGVMLVQKTQAGPRIPVGTQLEKAAVGPTSRPTWRLAHLWQTPRNLLCDVKSSSALPYIR
jgi:hypothetical protein